MVFIVFIVFIWILPSVLSQKDLHTNDQQTCEPFWAFIVWDLSETIDTFNVQRNFIFQIIKSTREDTNIRLDIMDTILSNVLDTKKNISDNWFTNIGLKIAQVKRTGLERNVIPYKHLMGAVSNFTNETVTAALELLFVVDNNSRIDKEESTLKELKKFKTFVAVRGTKPPPKFWTNIATDQHHLLELNDNIAGDIDDFLDLLCHDSKLYCNTDEYWSRNGKACKTCTFICARIPAEDPPYCLRECPYYRDRNKANDHSQGSGCNNLVPKDKLINMCFVSMWILMKQLL
ncbi:uncharacterized protein LOC123549823 [Mercenaria mercenaria]|uniref:uncharacterized protein LOC123549823 n=1 Tax=Mercenaria mercenaria TaxID=6596 RepID=UPI001E1D8BE6|nr:uncharacterized protein LOC123549823 [Mercenaria mercenaria]